MEYYRLNSTKMVRSLEVKKASNVRMALGRMTDELNRSSLHLEDVMNAVN